MTTAPSALGAFRTPAPTSPARGRGARHPDEALGHPTSTHSKPNAFHSSQEAAKPRLKTKHLHRTFLSPRLTRRSRPRRQRQRRRRCNLASRVVRGPHLSSTTTRRTLSSSGAACRASALSRASLARASMPSCWSPAEMSAGDFWRPQPLATATSPQVGWGARVQVLVGAALHGW